MHALCNWLSLYSAYFSVYSMQVVAGISNSVLFTAEYNSMVHICQSLLAIHVLKDIQLFLDFLTMKAAMKICGQIFVGTQIHVSWIHAQGTNCSAEW